MHKTHWYRLSPCTGKTQCWTPSLRGVINYCTLYFYLGYIWAFILCLGFSIWRLFGLPVIFLLFILACTTCNTHWNSIFFFLSQVPLTFYHISSPFLFNVLGFYEFLVLLFSITECIILSLYSCFHRIDQSLPKVRNYFVTIFFVFIPKAYSFNYKLIKNIYFSLCCSQGYQTRESTVTRGSPINPTCKLDS